MIISKEERKGIITYIVDKDCHDEDNEKKLGRFCTHRNYSFILDHDADVFTKQGKLLLRFRKNVLSKANIDAAFENLITFAKQKTSTRGTTSGTAYGKRNPGTNTPIMSNIIGYFDKWTIGQKHIFKTLGVPPPFPVRVSSFAAKQPEKWTKVIPLIQDIDRMYKKLAPTHHKKQIALANQTAYHIPKTSFTTITTNVNLQTAFHTDSGDYHGGFGNLVVIEKGKYKGGYTVFPQYGLGVDVRTGDFLAMDVHQIHGNTKITPTTKDAIRMSIVCYLRQDVYEKSKGTTHADVEKNIATIKEMYDRYNALKSGQGK